MGQGYSLCRGKLPSLILNYTIKREDVETQESFCLLSPRL